MFSPFGLRTLQKVLGVSDDSLVLPDAAFIPLATKAQGQLSDRAQGTAEVHFFGIFSGWWLILSPFFDFRSSLTNLLVPPRIHAPVQPALLPAADSIKRKNVLLL